MSSFIEDWDLRSRTYFQTSSEYAFIFKKNALLFWALLDLFFNFCVRAEDYEAISISQPSLTPCENVQRVIKHKKGRS